MEDIYTLGSGIRTDFHDPDSRNKYFERYHKLMPQNVIDIQILNVSDAFDFEVSFLVFHFFFRILGRAYINVISGHFERLGNRIDQ